VEGELTDDEIEKLALGDRIRRDALTGTVHTVGAELIGIKWDDKEWSELYTRDEMVQFSLVIGKGPGANISPRPYSLFFAQSLRQNSPSICAPLQELLARLIQHAPLLCSDEHQFLECPDIVVLSRPYQLDRKAGTE
jgi:hypothetical protein